MSAKKFKLAEQLFRRAISADPANLTAVHNLAGMYIQNEKPDLALTLLEKYRTRMPEDPSFPARIGDAWFVKRESQKARKAYEDTLALAPHFPGVSKKLASVCILEQDFVCAEKRLESAAQREGNNAEIFSNLANIYLAREQPQKAVAAATRALQLSPSGEVYGLLGDAYQAQGDLKRAKQAYSKAGSMGFERERMEGLVRDLEELRG